MVMRMLEAGGIEPITDGLRGADADNPRGYFELEDVKALPERRAWLEAAGGRAVKVVSALLAALPGDRRYRVIFLERDMDEVLASQRAMLVRRGAPTDRVSDEAMASMFRRHLAKVRAEIAERSEIGVLDVCYRDVIHRAEAEARRIADFLGGGLDVAAMARAVEGDLYRQRSAG